MAESAAKDGNRSIFVRKYGNSWLIIAFTIEMRLTDSLKLYSSPVAFLSDS